MVSTYNGIVTTLLVRCRLLHYDTIVADTVVIMFRYSWHWYFSDHTSNIDKLYNSKYKIEVLINSQ